MNSVARSLILIIVAGTFTADCGAADAARKRSHVASVVSATIDKDYRRTKNADGSYQVEHYALSFGGQAKGTTTHKTIDRIKRAEFEKLVKEQLAKQNYVMAPDAASAGLLIHLLWGMTDPRADATSLGIARNEAAQSLAAYNASIPKGANSPKGGFGLGALTPEQSAAEAEAESALMYMFLQDRVREQALASTASVLGYIDPVNDLSGSPALQAGLATSYSDMWDELSEPRFYVLVFAYDFKVLQESKQLKPLWVTRVSIRANGNRFDEQLNAMLARAGRYFGRRTRGLSRTIDGRVELGVTEVIGVVEDEMEKTETPPEPQDVPADAAPSEPAATDQRAVSETP